MSKYDEMPPTTAQEAFARLDALLDEEEKKRLAEDERAVINAHFSLGMWIRNNWIYPLNDEERRSFLKMFEDDGDEYFFTLSDEISSTIIDKYVKYLKNKS